MIKIQAIGHIGKDCVVKEINGKNVINFSVAHSEKYKDAQGVQHERTTWVECAYWTDKTTIAQYLTKGKVVYAEGVPSADAYADKSGNPAATLRMRCINIQLLGGGDNTTQKTESQSINTPPEPSQQSNSFDNPADDLPF